MKYLIVLLLIGCGKTEPDPAACYEIQFTPRGPAGCGRENIDTCVASGVDIMSLRFYDRCGQRVSWSARKL